MNVCCLFSPQNVAQRKKGVHWLHSHVPASPSSLTPSPGTAGVLPSFTYEKKRV